MDNPTLIVIADYGVGDPAFTEVLLRFKNLVPPVSLLPLSTPPFSTVNTGFWLYQLGMVPHLKNTFIFSNTAPRKHDTSAQKNNFGEKLMYAKLENGVEVMAVNSGYTFSFVKPHINELNEVQVENAGSQFRSRDFYPQSVSDMIHKKTSFLGQKQDPQQLPDYPKSVIASIDGYGNIKTTIRSSSLSFTPGQKVSVTIGAIRQQATYTDGVFNIEEGQLAFAPGSSGHSDKFMELFVRGASAKKLFDNPSVEEDVELSLG